MNKENIDKYFSKMTWLDEEIARNEASPGRNERSDAYYSSLKTIKEKQDRGEIPSDEDYLAVGVIRKNRKFCKCVEYGYYAANIRYDLFKADPSEKDSLEDRILYFIDHAEMNEYFKDYFFLNFPVDFLYYLCHHIYGTDKPNPNKNVIIDEEREEKLNQLYDAFSMRKLDDGLRMRKLVVMIESYGNDKEKLILNRLFRMI